MRVAPLAELLASLDSDPVKRGRQFERVAKWFLQNEPRYRSLLKQVWLWRDWPGRWGADAGIDLVAEANDGKTWAIQAKCYDCSYSVKKSDIDTFISESSRHEIDFRLLLATTNHIGKNALHTLRVQEKQADTLLLGDLERSEVVWPASLSALRPAKLSPKKRRPHQRQAVAAVLKGLRAADRGQLIMACGTGKTLVSLWVAEDMRSARTLVLLPSLSLLAQTLREWTANRDRYLTSRASCLHEGRSKRTFRPTSPR